METDISRIKICEGQKLDEIVNEKGLKFNQERVVAHIPCDSELFVGSCDIHKREGNVTWR